MSTQSPSTANQANSSRATQLGGASINQDFYRNANDQGSSSRSNLPPQRKWTKNHPFELIIGDATAGVKIRTIIGTKWVFRNKMDENGIVTRNKTRLVAKGYSQEE